MSAPVLPWQVEAWERLRTARETDRLPHALLLAGPGGIGKRVFARELTRALLCERPSDTAPCGDCAGCRQYEAGTHPDHIWLGPPEPGKAIPVDTVRGAIDRLSLSGRGIKVALIDSAEAMTTSAANSLLKTLEEPSGATALILISDRSGRLPATIRSRCQRVAFGVPPAHEALQWLAGQGIEPAESWLRRARGAPLHAYQLANEESATEAATAGEELLSTLELGRVPAEITSEQGSIGLAAQVATLIATVEDLIRLALVPHDAGAERLNRPEQRERMQPLAARLDARQLFDYLDGLYRSMPGAGDALRADIQYQGLLADAAAIARETAINRGGR